MIKISDHLHILAKSFRHMAVFIFKSQQDYQKAYKALDLAVESKKPQYDS